MPGCAGDAATRELICGAFTGGGSHNSAWAMSSGTFAGRGAAAFAAGLGAGAKRRRLSGVGGVGIRPDSGGSGVGRREALDVIQRQVHPYDKNYLRHGSRLRPALAHLDAVWDGLRGGAAAQGGELAGLRQAAAMVAHARWMYTSAIARTESRGMARREEYPDQDPNQYHRLAVGGLDRLWTRAESVTGRELAVA